MKAKKYLVKIMILAMVILVAQSTALFATEWVKISGTVYYNGHPLCVMVLANGEYMFTDAADGRYDMTVPLDANGEIILFSFCDGLAPYKVILESWEAKSFDIDMKTASSGSAGMNLSVTQSPSSKTGWVKLSGKASLGTAPLCAMILANGQHLFTPAETGKYELEIPLDSQGNITLFGFCEGLQPYKQVITQSDTEYAFGDTGKPDNYDSLIRDFSQFIDNFDTFLDNLPEKFDWRDRGVVSSAKDQGSCGSCWAFASVGAFEAKIAIKGASLNDLSEQQQVSCNDELWGCSGGNSNALKYWYNQGPMKESCTGYTADDTPCSQISSCEKLSFNSTGVYTVNTDDTKEIKASLYNDGPTYFRFNVYSDFGTFWSSYSPGKVYKNSGGSSSSGHAVLIIGWDDTKQAWLCKNSWGSTSGPNGDGTFWIAYSGHANDLSFGMTNFTLKGTDFKVKSPDGGEQWCAGDTYNITWETGDAGSGVKIELYKGGSRVQTVAERTENDGLYSWAVSGSLSEGSDYKIRISDYADSSVYDMSGSDFSVEQDCELKVKTPNGGEKWTVGSSYTVQWDPGLTGSTVNIYLFKGKEQMTIVASGVSNSGSYSWTIPDFIAEADDYKIYISLYYDSSVFDQSDGDFSIKNTVICAYSISSNSNSFTSSGGTGSVSVTAPDGCSWTTKSNATWISIKSGDNGIGNGIVNYSVSSYSEAGSRTGILIIAEKTFTVTQLEENPSSFSNSLGMTFNLIPAGTFMMGSPDDDETQHQVTLTNAFYMQTTEVTQGQWKAVTGSNPSYFSGCGDNCPVEYVSWDDIQGFITKMNQRGEGTYRLPTEAEWEYSARAGSTTAFYNGGITELHCGNDPNLSAIGWYCGNSGSTTHPVSQKQANVWGLYDMSGNVWEWCSDWYGTYPTGVVTNPPGPSSGSSRVLRGGGWIDYAGSCRSADRGRNPPGNRTSDFGFRLVLPAVQR